MRKPIMKKSTTLSYNPWQANLMVYTSSFFLEQNSGCSCSLQLQPEFCSREKLFMYFKRQQNEKSTQNLWYTEKHTKKEY